MNRSWLLLGSLSALTGVIFMSFSKKLFFTGMVIFFILSLTTQVSALQNPEANEQSSLQSKQLFISSMCYLIAGLLTLLF